MASPVKDSHTGRLYSYSIDEAFWSNGATLDSANRSLAMMSAVDRLYTRFPPPHALITRQAQRVCPRLYTFLREHGVADPSLTVMVYSPGRTVTQEGEQELLLDIDRFNPDFVLCPYLVSKVPACVYDRYLTLVYHPGPPGDGGPSSLDWLLLGDNGAEPDSKVALQKLRAGGGGLRSHWGGMVFQPTNDMDKGPVWAWEQYEMPDESVTKAQLYQTHNTAAAVSAFWHAIERVSWTVRSIGYADRSGDWVERIAPRTEWGLIAASTEQPFLGGPLHYRPLLTVKNREIDLCNWSASDIMCFIRASDSQPGARLVNLSSDSNTSLFVYGAQSGGCAADIPSYLYEYQEYKTFDEIPNGTAIATRDGAVLFKTRSIGLSGACRAVWIAMGRVIKPLGQPLEAKIPFTEAVMRAGHESVLEGVLEWPLDWIDRLPGQWQEIYVVPVAVGGVLAMFVYWDFYNGALSTDKCKQLLKVLMWATDPERGNVKALVLMGGHYFSNGIALNIIEDEASQAIENGTPEDADLEAGHETWQNINAMNDLVEFLIGDTHEERSDFLIGRKTLCERGIVTVASVRGNAAAGGVALAAACDHVIVSDRVTLNPAYRGMGLHGSEFHSWSYVQRCGQEDAGRILREMLPLSARQAHGIGLVDAVYSWNSKSRTDQPDHLHERLVATLLRPRQGVIRGPEGCGPWAAIPDATRNATNKPETSIADVMCASKVIYFAHARSEWTLPPLLHFRNEELSQMLLDSFHPTRSLRYHTRRRAFIRKVKCGKTPTRYMTHMSDGPDPEETEEFDHVGPWHRGQEWAFVGQLPPTTLATSAWTMVPLFTSWGYEFDHTLTAEQLYVKRLLLVSRAKGTASPPNGSDGVPEMISSISSSTLGDIINSPLAKALERLGSSPESSPPRLIRDLPPTSTTKIPNPEVEEEKTMYPCFFQDPAPQSQPTSQ